MSDEDIVTKSVPGYEGVYEVDSKGKIWSLNYHREHRRAEIVGKFDKDGYREVHLRKNGSYKYYRVHRLVALAFIPNFKNSPEINHKNGIKNDNRVENLEWCTTKENINHAWSTGLVRLNSQKGSNNNATKLIEDIVISIRRLKGKEKQRVIALRYNVSDDVVSMIHRQVNWKHITNNI